MKKEKKEIKKILDQKIREEDFNKLQKERYEREGVD